MDYKHLLIDGKNAIYRAVYAGFNDRQFSASNHDYFTILVKFLNRYRELFRPENMHIFWDSSSSDSWRRDLYAPYKAQRADLLKEEIRNAVNRQIGIAIEALPFLGFRQYFRPKMEADDLIYAFCKATMGSRTIIISSDADFKQIIFSHSTIDLHNPLNKNKGLLETIPDLDPIMVKVFSGDKSDNVNGFYRIGKVRSKLLTENLIERYAFLGSEKAVGNNIVSSAGIDLYKRNRLLIDLSLCPELLNNILYVEKKLVSNPVVDLQKFIQIMRKHQVNGIIQITDNYIRPFEVLTIDAKNHSATRVADLQAHG